MIGLIENKAIKVKLHKSLVFPLGHSTRTRGEVVVRSHFFRKEKGFYPNSISNWGKLEILEEVCEKLKLNEEEEVQIEIPLENNEQLDRKGERSLVGKIIIDQMIKREIVQKMIEKLWK